jgi:DNA-binding IclR family transcriptional regulator
LPRWDKTANRYLLKTKRAISILDKPDEGWHSDMVAQGTSKAGKPAGPAANARTLRRKIGWPATIASHSAELPGDGARDVRVRADELRDDGADGADRYWVRAVDRTIQLLEVLAESDGRTKTLSEVAHLSGMPESSALRYLATLAGRGVVEHDGVGADSRYRLGITLFSLAERALGNTDVRALALPLMQGLLDRFQETVNLAIFRQRRLVIIESLEGLRSIRQGARVGEQDRLRSTALGKAILATYADNEALTLLRAEPVERLTARTITNNEAILDELGVVRDRGYAIDDEESEVGLRCVGVAITSRPGPAYAMSISGPANILTVERAHEAGPALACAGLELRTRLHPRTHPRQGTPAAPPKTKNGTAVLPPDPRRPR